MNQKCRSSFLSTAFFLAIALSLAVGATPAWATVEEDQTALTDAEVAAAIANGEVNTVDDQAITPFSAAGSSAVKGTTMKSFSGAHRFETTAMQALYGWADDKSNYVIIAGDEGWSDALSASSLAGALACPVVITPCDFLSASAADAVRQVGASNVIIMGGESRVSESVEQELVGMGLHVDRIAGEDRIGTQLAVYRYGVDRGFWDETAFVAVASGFSFADALSFAPAAYRLKAPIFLTYENGDFNDEQKQVLADISTTTPSLMSNGAILIGGEARISAETESYLSGLAGSITRLAGADRFQTSAQIATWSVANAGCTWDGAGFTTGSHPYDALGGGALQGKEGSVLLLVGDFANNPAITAADASAVSSVKFFGGKSTVPATVRMDIAQRFGFSYAEIPDLKVYIDAGHGWNSSNNWAMDPGAIGSGTTEWALTSELAQKVGDQLRNLGVDVYVNDKGGWYKLRQAEAAALGCDLIVSIHFNAMGGSGTESYIHSYNASWMSASLQSKVHTPLVNALGLPDRGQMDMELAVCNGMPAVLLEVCFIDRWSDVQTYRNRIDAVAYSIAQGIAS